MPLRVRARRRLRLFLPATLALTFVFASASVALAAGDDVAADGDGTVPITALGQMQLGTICVGKTVTRTALVAAKRVHFTGVEAWTNSAVVTVTIDSHDGDGLTAVVATDNQLTLPSNWISVPDNTVSSDYVSSTVTITPTTTGSFGGFVVYKLSGQRASGGVGNHTETGGFNVFGNVVACPTIAIGNPVANATYLKGSSLVADYDCTTSSSAIVYCNGEDALGSVPDGELIDTSTVGIRSFTVSAATEAGGTSSRTIQYRVVYPFAWVAPVVGSPTLNQGTAGVQNNARFTLSGNHGAQVFSGKVGHRRVNCSTGKGLGSLLFGRIKKVTYNSTTDRYFVAWNVPASWAGQCHNLVVRLSDGTTHAARYHFN